MKLASLEGEKKNKWPIIVQNVLIIWVMLKTTGNTDILCNQSAILQKGQIEANFKLIYKYKSFYSS